MASLDLFLEMMQPSVQQQPPTTAPNSAPRPNKISRDVSNFIITQVLERSDDLIKNSYRRLTTENVARNEHWARIAEKVAEKFDQPAEMERVKSHFHNRKKVLLARIKDELKNIPNVLLLSTEEKLEELVKRRICVGEYDEQLAKVCLEIEEEERNRVDQNGLEMKMVDHLFTETSHQSLLSQLLSSSSNPHLDRPSPLDSSPSDLHIPAIIRPPNPPAPLLTKLLTEPSTSRENGFAERRDRKRKAVSPVLPSPNGQYLSHLIVDVTSPQELKRLLSILIDHGFSRFQHVGANDLVSSNTAGIRSVARPPRIVPSPIPEQSVIEDLFERDNETPFWNGSVPSNEDAAQDDIDVVKAILNHVEQIEVKVEPCIQEDEEPEEMDEELSDEVIKNSLALFGKPPSPKKIKVEKTTIVSGEAVTAHCELCGSGIRLSPGGSKWNLFEHVMMKHSENKPFKCSQCSYQGGRKARVRQHGISQHGINEDPIDMATPEIRQEWRELMTKCFPEHQYEPTLAAPVCSKVAP